MIPGREGVVGQNPTRRGFAELCRGERVGGAQLFWGSRRTVVGGVVRGGVSGWRGGVRGGGCARGVF